MLMCQCVAAGWEKPWVEQIVDRMMKGMLKTTEERAQAVVRGIQDVTAVLCRATAQSLS